MHGQPRLSTRRSTGGGTGADAHGSTYEDFGIFYAERCSEMAGNISQYYLSAKLHSKNKGTKFLIKPDSELSFS